MLPGTGFICHFESWSEWAAFETVEHMPDAELNHDSLRKLEQQLKAEFDEHLAVRVHRCVSWIGRAETEIAKEDYDAAFIFYWIAFNSIYSAERFHGASVTERNLFTDFFKTIVELDHQQSVYNAIWDRFSSSIRNILNNWYVFGPYWESINSKNKNWEDLFERNIRQALKAFERKDTVKVLSSLFERLYVLRNQLMHGGATWRGTVNRRQVKDGARILNFLVPIMVRIMMMHPGLPWSKPYYPVIEK